VEKEEEEELSKRGYSLSGIHAQSSKLYQTNREFKN
jgi:hypothetical protein